MWRHKGGEAGMEEALRRLKGALGKGRGWTRGMVRALEERRFAGEAGGGMVELQMNGLGRLLDFKVDPALGRHHESQNALFKMLQEDPSDTTDVEPEQKHDGDVSQRQNTGRQEEYDYRANNTIQHAGVQYILDSIIAALQNPERKWWSEQSEDLKTIIVHSLVGARRCGEEKEAGEESPAARTCMASPLQ
ncbi:uncharacterized protein ACA1_288550 [Acanthamoeba castellanii str. Neff]|uniref:Uncharacterized protein n=1 Tax=Acanthamoeba castellanii (strain ATCC 30010 / Neff) TaxID=1257118 RepID=L8HHU9_ACACF|nr:uncharacterized protein ACA1_288550 [Acanthamoeba castellanii str. Neff]ELR25134.1 hypothetical protein ACA1_288550 [Acanthamoeba castellanii str. Neff]